MPAVSAAPMNPSVGFCDDIGVTKKFLIREWERAQKETVTPNCKMQCSGCGAKSFGGGVCYENQN